MKYIAYDIAERYLSEACSYMGSNGGMMTKIRFAQEPTIEIIETSSEDEPIYCPLCGGTSEINIERESAGMDGSYKVWVISCTKCGLRLRRLAQEFYGHKPATKEDVIKAWNRRVYNKE